MNYIKCDLLRQKKGRGNSCPRNRGEFIILNDDTYEVWKRNGENMANFKIWYMGFSKAANAKLIGEYPRYEFIEHF